MRVRIEYILDSRTDVKNIPIFFRSFLSHLSFFHNDNLAIISRINEYRSCCTPSQRHSYIFQQCILIREFSLKYFKYNAAE